MSNTLMAVYTSLVRAWLCGLSMLLLGHLVLHLHIHPRVTMAVATFARIRALHSGPLMLRQFQPFGLEFFLGIDGARQLAPYFPARLNLALHLVYPVLGNVAIGTDCTHAGTIRGMDGCFVFLINGILHLVAGKTKLESVSRFHRSIEATPENYTRNEAPAQQRQQRITGARATQRRPQPLPEFCASDIHNLLI